MNIRKATEEDLSRIAEIFVFNNRINYFPIFKQEDFSFGELQVVSLIENYFGKIKYLRKGDEIIYKSANDSTFSYKVESVENLLPTQVEKVISTEYDLTLFTCTFNGQARVVVRCKDVNIIK